MTKAQSIRQCIINIHIKIDSACVDGSLILLFALILTFCQAQQGNMAGGARIHGYRLEMVERLEGAGTEELSWQGSWQFRSLIEVLLHVGGNVLDGQHGLFACGFDLRCRQQEAITTSVTQLKGVGILHSQVIGPVIRASSSGVYEQIRRGVLFRVRYADDLGQPVHAFSEILLLGAQKNPLFGRQMQLQCSLNLQMVVAPGPLV